MGADRRGADLECVAERTSTREFSETSSSARQCSSGARRAALGGYCRDSGVRISDTSLPEPDVLICPQERSRSRLAYSRDRNDVIVAFEILSPFDQRTATCAGSATAYTSLPSLTHYVVIAQDAIDVVVFARDSGFAERRLRSLRRQRLNLPSLGISLPLSEIYRDTGLK